MMRSLFFIGLLALAACGGGGGGDRCVPLSCAELSGTAVFQIGSSDGGAEDLGSAECASLCKERQAVNESYCPNDCSHSVTVRACTFVPLDGGMGVDCSWADEVCPSHC
jgi:hypothetical protein